MTPPGLGPLTATAAALLAAAAPAQYLNRAVYLGSAEESVRRDFEQDAGYFMDRFSYVDLPPWWNDPLDPFRNRLMATGGSVSSDELTVESQLNLGLPIGSNTELDFYYLASENQSTQYLRVASGLDVSVSDSTSLFAMIEGTAEKEEADISLGVNLFRSERSRVRLMVTLVDFASRKAQDFSYEKDPTA